MTDFRKIMGPFGLEVTMTGPAEIRWGFIGILADWETAHWMLTYKVAERKFFVVRSKPQELRVNMNGRPGYYSAGQPVDKDMFIKGNDKVIASGTITEVLRSRLRPEDIALCARLSMQKK